MPNFSGHNFPLPNVKTPIFSIIDLVVDKLILLHPYDLAFLVMIKVLNSIMLK